MNWLVFILFMISGNAFACWNMKAVLEVGAQNVKIDQVLAHDKTYSFPTADLIFHVKIVPKTKGTHLVEIHVEEKSGINLKEVANGLMLVKSGQEAIMTKSESASDKSSKFIIKVTEI